jgi:hypothetical protein
MLPYIIAILIPLALLVLFMNLVSYEERRGSRLILAGSRYELDRKAARVFFIIRHVDWGAFVNDLLRSSTERLLHDIAHGSLIVVRALERALTRTVRTLRARRDMQLFPARDENRPSRIAAAAAFVRRSIQRSRTQLPLRLPTFPITTEEQTEHQERTGRAE